VRLKGNAGDLGEVRSGEGRRGSRAGRCTAGGARRKKGKEEIGADKWGRGVRGREEERRLCWRRGAGLSAGGGGGPIGAGRVRDREGEWAAREREPA
jgi:hypothetical protein